MKFMSGLRVDKCGLPVVRAALCTKRASRPRWFVRRGTPQIMSDWRSDAQKTSQGTVFARKCQR